LEEAMRKSKLGGQTVSHASRVHLDSETDAIEAAVGGLNSLGVSNWRHI
jgi:hypothetical protein